MQAIAVYSLKGGVGKTTLAVSLAWASATRSARRTLLWDVDPQAAATFLLGDGRRGKQDAQAVFARDVDPAKHASEIEMDLGVGTSASCEATMALQRFRLVPHIETAIRELPLSSLPEREHASCS